MLILALDTAGSACSVAVWRDGRTLHADSRRMPHGQADLLMPMAVAAMSRAGAVFADLDLIAATVGPGSFTGVRIGLAAAGGLALAVGCPIAGISSLLVSAAAIGDGATDRPILAAIESRRRELFVQAFGRGLQPLSAAVTVAPADLATALPAGRYALCGDGAARLASAAPGGFTLDLCSDGPADPEVLARLAADRRDQATTAVPEPLYLRPADAMPQGDPRARTA